MLLPSLGMLLIAVAKRIGQYGITEPRYFLLVLTLWLLALAIYYAWSGSDNIKLIPTSLCLVALFTAIGPWGAYPVSLRSQTARLDQLLAEHGMGRVGAITRSPTGATMQFEHRRELSALMRYMSETHGPGRAARVMGGGVTEEKAGAWKQVNRYASDDPIAFGALDQLGVKYVGRWEGGSPGRGQPTNFWANSSLQNTYDVAGFEAARTMTYSALGWLGTATDSLELGKGETPGSVAVKHDGAVIMIIDLNGPARAALPDSSELAGRGVQLTRPVVVESEGGGYRLRLYLDNLAGQVVGQGVALQSANLFVVAAGFAGKR